MYYLQHGEEEVKAPPKRPRAAAELEVRPGRSREDQIAVVIATLLDEQKSDALDTMKTIIGDIVVQMQAWDHAAEARRLLNADNPEVEAPKRDHIGNYPLIRSLIQMSILGMKISGRLSSKTASFSYC